MKKLLILLIALLPLGVMAQTAQTYVTAGDSVTALTDSTYIFVDEVGAGTERGERRSQQGAGAVHESLPDQLGPSSGPLPFGQSVGYGGRPRKSGKVLSQPSPNTQAVAGT